MGGSILLDGKAIHEQPTKALSRRLGILPQSSIASYIGDLPPESSNAYEVGAKFELFDGITAVSYTHLDVYKRQNQFLGMEPLPTFIANDVIKMPDVPRYTEEYRKHLVEIFG